ncbi:MULTISPECIES: SMI1/KNR4 family protein [Arthrobacter]|uniref:SMI1/KNR4 family protein n=1 Tax=Arthrobacter TaxID=1663 RepID=UPI0027D7C79B|nr:SMI1/KNR4 family protein [Arthrobacter bambusae]
MLVEKIQRWGDVTFGAPASADAIQACEAQLGHRLPDHLRQLLAETNGIEGEYGLGLLWSSPRSSAHSQAHPDWEAGSPPTPG